jgi:undecaprenyl-diphosphatase
MKPDSAAASAAPARTAGVRNRWTRWFAWEQLRETWRQAKLGWMTVPTAVKLRCAITLGVGFAACLFLTAGLTFLAKWRAPHGLDAWDQRMLAAFDRQNVISYQNAVLLESFGNLAYLIPLTAACALIAARKRKPLLALGFVISYVLARPIVLLGWWIWNRPRPDIILAGKLRPPLHSFPSGHVVLAISIYGLLATLWVRAARSWSERVLAVLLAISIVAVTGLSRGRLGTHWPSDLIAGGIIGLAWLTVMLRALHHSRSLS